MPIAERLRKVVVTGCFAVLSGCLLAPAHAQSVERPAVVELFTSQGCSSCPPADRLIGHLAQRSDLIVLSFPVDIWDYAGWKDTLARSEFSARQRSYAVTRGDQQVYTPQAVVDGRKHLVGSDKDLLFTAISKTGTSRGAVGASMALREANGMVIADLGPATGDIGQGGAVWLLRVARSRTIAVGRGENSGHKLTYTNVVRSMVSLGFWSGREARFELPISEALTDGADGYVVVVQKTAGGELGPILAAAKSAGL